MQDPPTMEDQASQGNPGTQATPATNQGQSSQATPLPNTVPSKDKGVIEPPNTCMVPTTSSMAATTSSMAPITSSMAATTTSFVAESSLGREAWERRPITRSVGKLYKNIWQWVLLALIDMFGLNKCLNVGSLFQVSSTKRLLMRCLWMCLKLISLPLIGSSYT